MSKEQDVFDRTVAEAVRRARIELGTRHEVTRTLTNAKDYTDTKVANPRQDVVIATASIANLALESSSIAMPGRTTALLTITADRVCWVRVYATEADEIADNARALGTLGTAGTGLLAEFEFTGATTIPASPVAIMANDETPTQQRLWYTIQNRSGGAAVVTVTLSVILLEA